MTTTTTASLGGSRGGSGRPVVLLPWFGLDAAAMEAAFEPVFADLPGFGRLYLDLPGVGASPPVEPSTDAVVDAVLAALEEVAAEDGPAILIGCSYGGYVAAGATRRRPELVTALGLVCSGVRIGRTDRTVPDVPRTSPLSWSTGITADTRSHLELALATDDSEIAAVVGRLVETAEIDEDYLESLRTRGYQVDDEDDESPYDGPTLMLTGRQDRIAGFVDQFAAMSRYPHGTYAAVDGAGHYLPFEQPEAFAALVRSWLGRVRA